MGLKEVIDKNEELRLVRRRLHKYVSPKILATLNAEKLEFLKPYIYPMSVEKLKGMLEKHPIVWHWLVDPSSDLIFLEDKRKAAMDILADSLSVDVDSFEEGCQVTAYKEKIALARSILNLTEVKSENKGQLSTKEIAQAIPKHLSSLSADELEEEVLRLEEENGW